MVFKNKYIKFFLVLLQCCTSLGYGLNIDCNGKAFHCVNSTHFKICVDLGGVSKTVDDFLLPCPDNTFCMPTNHYECEYHEITTSTTTAKSDFSAITSDLSEVSVIPLHSTERRLDTTTAATVQDDTEYKDFSKQETIIEKISDKLDLSSLKDEKLTLLLPKPTEPFLDKSFDFDEVKNNLGNATKDFQKLNRTKYSSVKSEIPNNISDEHVLLNESPKRNNVNNSESIINTNLTEQKNLINDSKSIEKNVENVTSDYDNVFNANNFSVEIKIKSEISENNIKNSSMNVSSNIGSGKDVKTFPESISANSSLSTSYSTFSKKSIPEILTDENDSSVLNIVLNKTSNENGVEKPDFTISKHLSTVKNNSSYGIIINSESLDSRTLTFRKAIEKLNIDITTTPNNNEISNLQAATDIDDVEILGNFTNDSKHPNIIINGNNVSFDEEKQKVVSNNTIISKLSKEIEVVEASTVDAISFETTFFDGDNSYYTSTESPEVNLTTINIEEDLRKEMETNNASKFTNLNNLHTFPNETKENITTSEIANDIVTTDVEDSITYSGDSSLNSYILYSTTQQSETLSPITKPIKMKEINFNNYNSILEIQTTTEYEKVAKINNLNLEHVRDNPNDMMIRTEKNVYYNKNEPNDNMTDYDTHTEKETIKTSSMLVRELENNKTNGSTSEVLKKAFDSEKYSDDMITASSTSYSNLLYTTINSDTEADLKDEVLMPIPKNNTTLIFSFPSTTNEYLDTDPTYTSSIDNKETNIKNTSITSDSSLMHTTTESYAEANIKDTFLHSIEAKSNNNYNTNKSEVLNITTTSINLRTPLILTATERNQANFTIDYLSLTDAKDIMLTKNKNESKWIDNPTSVAVKQNIINTTSTLNSPTVKNDMNTNNNIPDFANKREDTNADSNTNTTYSAHNTSSFIISSTEYDAISTTTDNLYNISFQKKVNQTHNTNNNSNKDDFITNNLEIIQMLNKTPIVYNNSSESVPSVLKNTFIEIYETTTQTGLNNNTENDGKSNGIFSRNKIDKELKSASIPDSNFQEYLRNIFNLTLIHDNETTPKIQQEVVETQKVIMNSSEVNNHLFYPIHLLLLSKRDNSEINDDKLEVTAKNVESINFNVTLDHNIVKTPSLDQISSTHGFTTNTLNRETEESTEPLMPKPIITHNNMSSTIIDIINASKAQTNISNQSVPIKLLVSISKESQSKQTLNATEPFQSKLPTRLTESKNINLTDQISLQGKKHEITVKNYTELEKDYLPLKSDGIILHQIKNSTISINDSALFDDSLSTPKITSTIKTTLAPQFQNDVFLRKSINATSQDNLSKVRSVSDTSKQNNFTTNFIKKIVNDFYSRTSETNSNVKNKINSENYINSDTPANFQITERVQSTSDTTLVDDTMFTSLDEQLKSTIIYYEYTTNTYSSHHTDTNIKLNPNNNLSGSTLIENISVIKDISQHKLIEITSDDQPSTTPSIEISTKTSFNYLLTQIPAPVLTLQNKSENNYNQNVTENILLNLPESISIPKKDSLNSSTEDFKSFSLNVSKPVNTMKNKEIIQLTELKTSETQIPQKLQPMPKTNKNNTEYTVGNLDNPWVMNLNKSRNSTSYYSPILREVKSTTVKLTLNDLNSDNINVNEDHLSVTNMKKSANSTSTIKPSKEIGYVTPIIMEVKGTTVKSTNNDLSTKSVKADSANVNRCLNQPNGKYADKYDCKKFYLCLGDAMPVLGECPNGTVFSESKKQCTKNLSQCYRNNQFTCISPGRYYDLTTKNVYYICVKNRGKFIKFKYQCQNGYSLNDTIVKCIKDPDISAQNSSDSSNTKEDSTSISVESSSKVTENDSSKKSDKEFECKKEGKFPHPKKCKQYYLCTKVKKSVFRRKLKTCNLEEVFDKEKQQCVDSDSHECS